MQPLQVMNLQFILAPTGKWAFPSAQRINGSHSAGHLPGLQSQILFNQQLQLT
jgi:hypothetical protein